MKFFNRQLRKIFYFYLLSSVLISRCTLQEIPIPEDNLVDVQGIVNEKNVNSFGNDFKISATTESEETNLFNGENAFIHVKQQLLKGYRIPGSESSNNTAQHIKNHLEKYEWEVEFQEFTFNHSLIRNIIAKNKNSEPEIILGTHYDTRRYSDREEIEEKSALPVPGANDGASGTGVLIELSRILEKTEKSIWLVFFDAEDQGHIEGWDWSIGSRFFVNQLEFDPESVIIIDMIGDSDLQLFKELNSDKNLTDQVWKIAEKLNYGDFFINQEKYALIDDHLPFVEKGISACLIIDFDYPYWHTREDTLDKVSSQSLQIVGEVLLGWINQ